MLCYLKIRDLEDYLKLSISFLTLLPSLRYRVISCSKTIKIKINPIIKSMKVVYILATNWGGIPHYTAELANAISRYIDDVVVLKPKDSYDDLFSKSVQILNVFRPIQFSRKNMLRVFDPQNIINFLSYRNIKLVDNIKPDIIHFPELYPYSSIFTFLYKIHEKYPIISTLHATFESPVHLLNLKNFIDGLLASVTEFTKYLVKSEIMIVHTRDNKNTLIKRGVPPNKVVVIPHGVYNIFKKYIFFNKKVNNKKEKEIEIKQEYENCVLFFGYLGRNKGLEYLIEAIPIVSQEIPDIKVIIAGEGDFSKYQKLIKDNSKFEIYNEFIPNQLVPKLFKRAKVIVLPYTYHQGHSGVLNIAFAFGKPAIVTNVGSLPDMVEHGKAGIVVPPKDSKALAEAIIKVLEDDKLRKKLSRNALKMAEKLSWDRIAKMHIKVYERVLEEKR